MSDAQCIVEVSENHMATTFAFKVACPRSRSGEATRVLEGAHREVSRLEDVLSEFRPSSDVAQLNSASVDQWVEFTPEALELLILSERLSVESARAFSHLAKSTCADPTSKLERRGSAVRRRDSGVRLSFGAIGKGFAIDRAVSILVQEGFADYVLSAGGSSIAVSGRPDAYREWPVSWSWTKDEAGSPLGLELRPSLGSAICLGVSGTHEQGSHLLNPMTGAPAESPLQSALISHRSAAVADAFSTALYVGQGDLSRIPDSSCGVAVIDSAGVPRWNGHFQRWFGALASLALVMSTVVRADESVDLSADVASSFNPYLFERAKVWTVLPWFGVALVLIHLIRVRPPGRPKRNGVPPKENA